MGRDGQRDDDDGYGQGHGAIGEKKKKVIHTMPNSDYYRQGRQGPMERAKRNLINRRLVESGPSMDTRHPHTEQYHEQDTPWAWL